MRYVAFWLWCVFSVLLGLSLFGCSAQEIICSPSDFAGCVVDEIEVIGNRDVSDDEIKEKIATSETGTILEGIPLLGAIDGLTIEYERLDRYVLERDLMRVERYYRARGYYDAVVSAGRVRRIDPMKNGPDDVSTMRLLVEILVDEGAPVVVGDTSLEWKDWDSTKVAEADAGAAAEDAKTSLKRGKPFREDEFEATRQQIQAALTDIGFAYAAVESKADIDISQHRATVRYIIELGPRCTFGPVELTGLGPLPEWQIKPALTITTGERYSTEKLRETQQALSNFGVLSTVSIEPQLTKEGPRETAIPIRIRVQPAALGSVRLGGGLELGDQVAIRAVASWQHKNATRALDRFAVEARPRLVFYPWRITSFTEDLTVVPEALVRVQYSLPFPFDPKTNLFVQSQASIGLVQNADAVQALVADAEIRGEYLLEHRQGAERPFFGGRLLAGLSHNLSFSSPFSYDFERPLQGATDSLLISMLQGQIALDLRTGENGEWNGTRPVAGVLASVNMEVAGYFLGGDANDFKVRPELRFLAPLAKRLVLAGRVSMGFLFTDNYGFVLDNTTLTEADVADDGGDLGLRTRVNRDLQILEKRGLFAGGPSSNRGYGFNQISPLRMVDPGGIPLGIAADATGGRTSWEGSVELRFPIVSPLGGVVFVDAADVTPGIAEIRFDHPHMAGGLGLRYDTPVGPLRIDLGYKIPYLQVAGEEDPSECQTGGLAAGADPCALIIGEIERDPFALSIAIGNAF